MTVNRLCRTIAALDCSKMKAKILELSKMALFQVDSLDLFIWWVRVIIIVFLLIWLIPHKEKLPQRLYVIYM